MLAEVRKGGEGLAVAIPQDEVERLGLREGDVVDLELRVVRVGFGLRPAVRAAFDEVRRQHAEGITYLAER